MRPQYLETPRLPIPDQLELDRELMREVGAGRRPPLLRFYDFTGEAVVLGLAQEAERYVNLAAAAADGVPVLRRFSGGGTVFLHPGCLVYSLVFPLAPPFRRFDVKGAYHTAFAPIQAAFRQRGLDLEFHDPCDLAIDGRKVAGSAQAQRDRAVLVHGSFLVSPDLDRIRRYLKEPDVVPEYRRGRTHADFLLPLQERGLDLEGLRALLLEACGQFD